MLRLDSMTGKSPMISPALPFVLRLSKDERRVFQQNRCPGTTPQPNAVAPEYTEAAFSLCRIGSSQMALQIIVPIVRAVPVTASRTVIYRRSAVLYGTR